MKDGMSGMIQQVRLGQVRKARKSSIIRPPPPSFPCPFFEIQKKIVRLGVTLEVLGDERRYEWYDPTS
jgi:hypothetical protein